MTSNWTNFEIVEVKLSSSLSLCMWETTNVNCKVDVLYSVCTRVDCEEHFTLKFTLLIFISFIKETNRMAVTRTNLSPPPKKSCRQPHNLQCRKDQHLFLRAVYFLQENSPPGLLIELVYSDSVILEKETHVYMSVGIYLESIVQKFLNNWGHSLWITCYLPVAMLLWHLRLEGTFYNHLPELLQAAKLVNLWCHDFSSLYHVSIESKKHLLWWSSNCHSKENLTGTLK